MRESTKSALTGMVAWLIVAVPTLAIILLAGWLAFQKSHSLGLGVFYAVALIVWLVLLVRRYQRD